MTNKSSARAVVGFSVSFGGINMVKAFCNAILPIYLGRYGVPAWLVGVLAQQDSSIGGILQPLVGLLSDRTWTRMGRRRPYLLAGVLPVVASLLLLAASPPLWVVALTLTLLAFFLAVVNGPYKSLLGDIFPTEQRGLVGGVMAAFSMLGQVAILIVASRVWEYNESFVFYLIALCFASTLAITIVAVNESLPPTRPPSLRQYSLSGYLKDILSDKDLSKYALSQLVFFLGIGGVLPFLTRFGVQVLGMSEASSFLLFVVMVVSTALFTVPAGLLGDRRGKKRVLGWGLVGFVLIAAVGSQTQNAMQGMVVMALAGVPCAIVTSLGLPLFIDLMPSSRTGEFVGLAVLVTSPPQMVGAGLMGILIDIVGNYRVAFIAAGLLVGISYYVLRMVHSD